jgi:hypothetical protein
MVNILYIYVFVYICTSDWMDLDIYECMGVHTYVYKMHISMYVFMYVCIYLCNPFFIEQKEYPKYILSVFIGLGTTRSTFLPLTRLFF